MFLKSRLGKKRNISVHICEGKYFVMILFQLYMYVNIVSWGKMLFDLWITLKKFLRDTKGSTKISLGLSITERTMIALQWSEMDVWEPTHCRER